MGQKVHPESMRVGYIHDWQSNWFNERNFAEYLAEDVKIREHIVAQAGARRPVGHHDPQGRQRGRGQHPHRAPRHRDRQVRQPRSTPCASDLHRMTRKQIKVNILEIKRPELDAKLVAQSIAEQLQNRVAFRRAMKRALDQRHALGRQGRQGPGVRPPRRRGDGAHRGLLRRARPAAHDARRHRLRLLRGAHDLRADRREVLDQQGRDHARGLHRHRPHRHERPGSGDREGRGDEWARRTRQKTRRPQRRGGRGPGARAAAGPGGRAGARSGGPGAGPGPAGAVERGRRARSRRRSRERCADAGSQARQAPQAAPRPPPRALARAGQGSVRRVRPEVARGRAGSPTARSRLPVSR